MEKTFVKVDEVARRLSLSKAMVYRLIQQGRIPCLRIGSAVRIQIEDVDNFIIENMIQLDDKSKTSNNATQIKI